MLLSSSLFAMEEQANTPSLEGANLLCQLRNAREIQNRQADLMNLTVPPIVLDPSNDLDTNNNNALEPLPLDEVIKNVGKYHCDKCAVTFEDPTLAIAHTLKTKHASAFRYFQHTQTQAESGNANNSSNASISRLVTENLSPRLNTQFGNQFSNRLKKTCVCAVCNATFITREQMRIHMGTMDHRHGFVKK